MGDHINVAIRIRPPNQREQRLSAQVLLPWTVHRDTITQRLNLDGRVSNGNSFTFDRVFDQKENTQRVYDDVVKQIIVSSMNGFNGTIFAYGQTSSGKTHTMHGSNTELGIIARAVGEMFRIVESDPEREYLIRVSFLEIYNEILRDLLEPSKTNLKIHENARHEIFVGDLSEHIVFNANQVEEVLQKGDRNRHIAGTNMNERSSRSHTIFRIVIESREKADAEGEDVADGANQAHLAKRQQRLSTGSTEESSEFTGAVKVSCLNLVDLAGTERVGQTGAEGQRLKEGAHINKSLMALGTVIARLSEEGGDKGHIPYRDSKLTRILQPSIGGNAKTLIICTVTPSPDYVDETLSTLKFASRAKTIENKPEVNEELRGDALLRRLKRASELEKEVAQMKDIERKKLKIEADNEQLLRQLWKSQKERERLQKELEIQQTNMFLPKSNESKNAGEAILSIRRQTWFPGLQKPLVDSGNGPNNEFSTAHSPAGVGEKNMTPMDTDDVITPRHSIDGSQCGSGRSSVTNGSGQTSDGDNLVGSHSESTAFDPEFNHIIADKLESLEASNERLQQQRDDLTKANSDMEGTIQQVMREYNLLLKTLNQLAMADTIPPSPARPNAANPHQIQQQPHELVQIRRKLRALMTTIDASQKQCQRFRSQRPEAEFLELELQSVRETLVQKEEQLVEALHESDDVFSKFTELELKLVEAEDSCHRLRTELETAKGDEHVLAEEQNRLRIELDDERRRLNELTHANKENIDQALAKAMSKHAVVVDSLQATIAEQSQERESLQKQLEDVQQSSSDFEKRVSDANSELAVARDQISKLTADCETLLMVRSEAARKDMDIHQLTEQLQDARDTLAESSLKICDMEAKLVEQGKELEFKTAECDENACSVSQLSISIEQLAHQLGDRDAQATAEVSKAQKELCGVRDSHAVEKKHMESLVEARAKEIGVLQQKVDTLSKQLLTAEDDRQRLTLQISANSDQADTVSALSKEAKELRNSIALLESSGEQLKISISEKQQQLELLASDKTQLNQKVLDLESQNADIWERVSELTVINNDLNDKVSGWESSAAKHGEQIVQLETIVSELTIERDSLQTTLETTSESHRLAIVESEQMAAKIQDDLNSRTMHIDILESELQKSKESYIAISTSNSSLTAKTAEMETALSDMRSKAAGLQKDFEILQTKYQYLQNENHAIRTDCETQLSAASADVKARDNQIAELSGRLSSTKSEQSQQLDAASDRESAIRDSAAQLEASLESLRSQFADLQMENAEMDKNVKSLSQLNAELGEKLESKDVSIADLEARMASLQTTVDCISREKDEAIQMCDLVRQQLSNTEELSKKQIAELESVVCLKSRELEDARLAKDGLAHQLELSDMENTKHSEHVTSLKNELDSKVNRISQLSREHEQLIYSMKQELGAQQQQMQGQIDQTSKMTKLAEESQTALQLHLSELQLRYESNSQLLEETERSKAELLRELRQQQEISASADDSKRQIADIQESHHAAVITLKDKMGVVEAERDRLVDSMQSTVAKLDAANLDLASLQETNLALQRNHETVARTNAAAMELVETRKGELESELNKLQQQLLETGTHNDGLRAKVVCVENQNAQLLSKLESANAALEDANLLEKRLKEQTAQLELDLEDQSALLKDSKAQLASVCDASAEKEKGILAETEDLRAELQIKASLVEELTQSLDKGRQEMLDVLSERDNLKSACEDLAERAKETQTQLEQSVSELKEQITSKSIEIQELELALEGANSIVAASQKNDGEDEKDMVRDLSAKVKVLTEERDGAHGDVETLKGMMTELARVKDQDISELEDKIAQLEDLLDTSVRESLEKDDAVQKSMAIAAKNGDLAEHAKSELDTIIAKHEATVDRLTEAHNEIQARLETALENAEKLQRQNNSANAELEKIHKRFEGVDIELYESLPASLRSIVADMRQLPGCEGMAETWSANGSTSDSNSELLESVRNLLATAISAATKERVSESESSDQAQLASELELELERLRALNEKLDRKSRMLMDTYKHDMSTLRTEEESQRQHAERLRGDLDKQSIRAKELERELAKAYSDLEKQTEQHNSMIAKASKTIKDAAVSPRTPIRSTSHAHDERAASCSATPGAVEASKTASQKAELVRLASQGMPATPSNKRTHLSLKEADGQSPARMLSPLKSSVLNTRVSSANEDVQSDKYPPRKRTPTAASASASAAAAALAENALEPTPGVKGEPVRARSSYGDRRRIRRNQQPLRKDGLEDQAAEQCVQQ